jgi:hypothetical protein
MSRHQDRKRVADLSLPPRTVNVSGRLLADPPIGEGLLTTRQLRRALVLVGYAQKVMTVIYKTMMNKDTVQVRRAA